MAASFAPPASYLSRSAPHHTYRSLQVARDRQRLSELEAQVAAAEGGLRELDDGIKEMQSQMEQIGTEVNSPLDSPCPSILLIFPINRQLEVSFLVASIK